MLTGSPITKSPLNCRLHSLHAVSLRCYFNRFITCAGTIIDRIYQAVIQSTPTRQHYTKIHISFRSIVVCKVPNLTWKHISANNVRYLFTCKDFVRVSSREFDL